MLLSAEFVLVKEINSNVPRSNFSDTEIEKLARSILEVGGVIRPIVVRPTGIDSYEVVEGHLEYHAAVRAKEINGRDGERITAFVMEGPKAEAIQEQVKLLNEIESTQEQPQETAQKIDTEPVTAEPEKVNLLTAKKEDIQKAFKRYGMKWTTRVWDAIAYWQNPGKTLSWANIKKSAKSGPYKIAGFAIGTYSNLLRVAHIPA
ncbi:MAG: ParB N-terminal domain-containing protein [Trichodesmium sp. St11_bin5]|nr:ParB N-terminal domain-containing protein [Trichodesmium sp. St11_bin5]